MTTFFFFISISDEDKLIGVGKLSQKAKTLYFMNIF
jgi:hypothetical protein